MQPFWISLEFTNISVYFQYLHCTVFILFIKPIQWITAASRRHVELLTTCMNHHFYYCPKTWIEVVHNSKIASQTFNVQIIYHLLFRVIHLLSNLQYIAVFSWHIGRFHISNTFYPKKSQENLWEYCWLCLYKSSLVGFRKSIKPSWSLLGCCFSAIYSHF